jgi:hypothetical protein
MVLMPTACSDYSKIKPPLRENAEGMTYNFTHFVFNECLMHQLQ